MESTAFSGSKNLTRKRRSGRVRFAKAALLASPLIAVLPTVAHAAEYFFRTDGTPSLFNSSSWSIGSATATGGTAWNNSTSVNADFTANANLQGSTGTSTVGNMNVAAGLTVTFNTVTGTMFAGGVPHTIFTDTGAILNLSSQAISTASGTGFVKTGTGIFALTGGSSLYTGGFNLSAGTVVVGGVDALGGGTGDSLIIGGGTTLEASATEDFSGKFTAGISFIGNFTLGGTTGGAVAADNLTFSNNINLSGGLRTITLGGTGIYTLASNISNGGLVVNGSSGTLVLSGPVNTFAGGVTLNSGTTVITSDSAVGTLGGAGVIFGGGTLQFKNYSSSLALSGAAINLGAATGAASTLSSNIIGSSSLVFAGPGTLNLTGANTYLGTTTVNGGVLNLTTANSNAGATIINSGGVLEVATPSVLTSYTTAGTITVGNGGTLAIPIGGSGFTSAQLDGLTTAPNVTFASGLIPPMETSPIPPRFPTPAMARLAWGNWAPTALY
jgi:fibronectin-binding autotransporter adhesin